MDVATLTSIQETRLKKALKDNAPERSPRTGDQIIAIIKDVMQLKSSDEPKRVANAMLKRGWISPAGNEAAKRSKVEEDFSENLEYVVAPSCDEDYILNKRSLFGPPGRAETSPNAAAIAIELRKKIMVLFGAFLRLDGKGVDYQAAAKSIEFEEYGLIAEKLVAVDVANLEQHIPSIDERKALYLNLYNALIIHGHIVIGNPITPSDRTQFFTKTAYDVGGEVWTLDIIEHGFLRCNQMKPYATQPVLADTDPRVRHALPLPIDYRIHFALNCGAKSCPPIRFYSADKLNAQLDMATKGFFKDDTNLVIRDDDNVVQLTKLMEWYGMDFAQDKLSMLEIVIKYVEEPKLSKLDRLLHGASSDKLVVDYFAYDWRENDSTDK